MYRQPNKNALHNVVLVYCVARGGNPEPAQDDLVDGGRVGRGSDAAGRGNDEARKHRETTGQRNYPFMTSS